MKAYWSSLGIAACALALALPLAAASPAAKPAHAVVAQRTAWPPETLAGTIVMVDPATRTVVVNGPDGVPFDMMVTSHTQIRSGDRALTLQDLTQDTHQNVSVRFIPERRGDVANTIRLGS